MGGDGRMGEWKDDEVEEEGGAVGGQGERERDGETSGPREVSRGEG